MNRNLILEQINLIFRDVFENEKLVISEITSAKDIDEWDSLTHVMLISAVEKHFNIRLKFADIIKFKNVGDMVDLLERT
jgi:acyl carrier protein